MKPGPFVSSILSLILPATLMATPLDIGSTAPQPTASDHAGEAIDWADLYSRGYVLVFFYPKADTPGCTAQACSLRDDFETLTQKGVTVLGVSADNAEAQARFHRNHNLPFRLIPDPNHEVISAFGVPTRLGFASRQAFLIRDGKVVWRDLRASTARQAEDVLRAIGEFDS
ncbi:MAG: peroxiredoxin [Puniceicoccaceae bacterium]|nr:MAG: peroxiredoxin [Puniceicoccaceae bacterium]